MYNNLNEHSVLGVIKNKELFDLLASCNQEGKFIKDLNSKLKSAINFFHCKEINISDYHGDTVFEVVVDDNGKEERLIYKYNNESDLLIELEALLDNNFSNHTKMFKLLKGANLNMAIKNNGKSYSFIKDFIRKIYITERYYGCNSISVIDDGHTKYFKFTFHYTKDAYWVYEEGDLLIALDSVLTTIYCIPLYESLSYQVGELFLDTYIKDRLENLEKYSDISLINNKDYLKKQFYKDLEVSGEADLWEYSKEEIDGEYVCFEQEYVARFKDMNNRYCYNKNLYSCSVAKKTIQGMYLGAIRKITLNEYQLNMFSFQGKFYNKLPQNFIRVLYKWLLKIEIHNIDLMESHYALDSIL